MRYLWWALMLTMVFLVGCGGDTRPIRIGQDTEIEIGREAAADLEARYGVVNDPVQQARVNRIGQSIAAVSTRPDLPWTFRILNTAEVNALAIPGGFIYVTRGLLELGLPDNELAGILGHEVAHVDRRHSVEAIERTLPYQLLVALLLEDSNEALQQAAQLAIDLAVTLPNSRADEYESDDLGIRLAYNAGYPANGLLLFLQRLAAMGGNGATPEWLRTHPLTADRIARAQETVLAVQGQPRPVPLP